MELDAAIKAVKGSDEYRSFSKQSPEYRLAHAFSMHAPDEGFDWQLGFYSPKTQKLVVFKTSPVEKLPEDDAFNRGEEIKELDLKAVKLSPEEAERTAFGLKQEKFPAEQVTKIILVLQRLDRQVYNFTLVTMTFNILNVRVDAASGEIVSAEMRSIMSLRRDEDGKK